MAYAFASASSQYITCAAPLSAKPLTMAGRFAQNSLPSTALAIAALSAYPTSNRVQIQTQGSTGIYAIFDTATSSITLESGFTQVTGEWFAAGGEFSSSASRKTIANGATVSSSSDVGAQASLTTLSLGARYNSLDWGLFWNGRQAEFAIWSAALTDAEIASIAKGFAPRRIRPQSLVFYAPLVRAAIDIKGGLTLTPVNGPTVARHPRVYP